MSHNSTTVSWCCNFIYCPDHKGIETFSEPSMSHVITSLISYIAPTTRGLKHGPNPTLPSRYPIHFIYCPDHKGIETFRVLVFIVQKTLVNFIYCPDHKGIETARSNSASPIGVRISYIAPTTRGLKQTLYAQDTARTWKNFIYCPDHKGIETPKAVFKACIDRAISYIAPTTRGLKLNEACSVPCGHNTM